MFKTGISKYLGNGNGKFLGGFLLGSAGLVALSSRPARKLYSHVVAAGMLARDYILDDSEKIQAAASDVFADAAQIREKYYETKEPDEESFEEVPAE